jgi:hypothetical protein
LKRLGKHDIIIADPQIKAMCTACYVGRISTRNGVCPLCSAAVVELPNHVSIAKFRKMTNEDRAALLPQTGGAE